MKYFWDRGGVATQPPQYFAAKKDTCTLNDI